ncbi:SDR family oxidoreductase [Streptomyces sp. MS1.HAVA.3]|uniref:SDR family oxidoreductase n=1 Tax=Streptomyces caledonius TaxID=3134107 RepID=A0ABU8U297_9ACTN
MSRPIAVVTGASSGIGAEAALALGALGHDLVLGYGRNATAAKEVADRITAAHGVRTELVALDLGDPAAAQRELDRVLTGFGGIDVLVNNAGINRRAPLVEEDTRSWDEVFAVNLTSPFLLAQSAAARMIAQKRGGRIINVTSVHEHVPIVGGSTYCAAKAALGMLTKVMALELAPHGITVNAVAPGETATPMNGVPVGQDAATISRPAIPAGRPGRPQEVASLIAYLASPGAAYTTGTSVITDGGLTLTAAVANAALAGQV